MAEKHPLPVEGAPTTYADWPTLIERAVDDVSRILRSEAHMLQTSIEATLEAQISNTVALLTIVAVMISGAICILCAAILLLHQWLPWWEAFGIAGLATLVVGVVINAARRPPTEVKT
jgi:VIT1/CCC1 family predicted Fe2+/Mn2+ transporter